MVSNNDTELRNLAKTLGMDKTSIRKAAELCQLLSVRADTTTLASLRLDGSCRFVICLDLAAKLGGCSINRVEAVKLSSVNKRSYESALKVIESILDLNDHMTLKELAVQFGCVKAISLANDILKRYISDQCSDVDFNAPMFLCASLMVACRKLKIKIDAVRLREQSATKKASFDRLIKQLEAYSLKTEDVKTKTSSSKRKSFMDIVEENMQADDVSSKKVKSDEETEKEATSAERSYDEWKRNILARAKQAS